MNEDFPREPASGSGLIRNSRFRRRGRLFPGASAMLARVLEPDRPRRPRHPRPPAGEREVVPPPLPRRRAGRGEHPALGTANPLFRLENTYLELLAPAGPVALADAIEGRLGFGGRGSLRAGLWDARTPRRPRGARRAGLEPGARREGPRPRRRTPAPAASGSPWLLPGPARAASLLFAIEHRSPPDLLPDVPPARQASRRRPTPSTTSSSGAPRGRPRRLYGEAHRPPPRARPPLRGLRLPGRSSSVSAARPLEVAAPLAAGPDPGPTSRSGLAWQVGRRGAAQRRASPTLGFDVSPVRPGRKPGTAVCTRARRQPAACRRSSSDLTPTRGVLDARGVFRSRAPEGPTDECSASASRGVPRRPRGRDPPPEEGEERRHPGALLPGGEIQDVADFVGDSLAARAGGARRRRRT